MGNQNWETPDNLFNYLHSQHHFTIDAAADHNNHKLPRYLSEQENALTTTLFEEIIWCNPPYATVLPWANKFIEWAEHNRVIVLLQDRTDVAWFKLLWAHSPLITFFSGRVQFLNEEGIAVNNNNRGSVLFELGQDTPPISERVVKLWDWKRDVK